MGMNAGTTMQPGIMHRPQLYQAHVRNNSESLLPSLTSLDRSIQLLDRAKRSLSVSRLTSRPDIGQQHMSPSSPGFLQSPTSFNTSTPPAGAMNQAFYPQPTPSPTKQTPPTSTPVSQPQISAGSPQAMTNSLQKPHNTPPLKPILQPPLSPEAAKMEAQRVGAILDINRALIQEVMLLQVAGRTGPTPKPGADQGQNSPTVAENASTDGKDATGSEDKDGESKDGDGDKKKQVASREYMEYVTREFQGYMFTNGFQVHAPPPGKSRLSSCACGTAL